MLRFALAQLNPIVGNLEYNLNLAIDACQQAITNSSNIIIFPELFLTGYMPEDLLLEQYFLDKVQQTLDNFIRASKNFNLHIIIGSVYQKNNLLFNSAFVIYQGNIQIQHKKYLPNYGVFDEKRYFTHDIYQKNSPFIIQNTSINLLICEDMWQEQYLEESDILICINASPFAIAKDKLRLQALSKHNKNTIYLNMAGAHDEIIFDGNSLITDKNNNVIKCLSKFKEEINYIDWCKNTKQWICNNSNAYNNKCNIITKTNYTAEIYQALVLGTKNYVQKNGFSKIVIGISGGVDSALVACIAKDALGAENVHTIMMPTKYTADISLIDAKQLAQNLGISYEIINIQPIFDAFKQNLSSIENLPASFNDVTFENLQARIRGNILMSYSNRTNALVLTTGNKSELAVGYCTLYGDMAGAYAVIKDILKTKVYELCKYYNFLNKNSIPDRILTRAPSAELKDNQTDQDSLPDYAVLDEIIFKYVELKHSPQDIASNNIDINLVHKIIHLIKINEYKRKQAPIGPKITTCSFGKDWRYSLVNGFKY